MPDAPVPSPCAASIEEEVISAEEYHLISAAVSSAEYGPTALSTYLSRRDDATRSSCSSIVLTLRPRPRFPPPLHSALLPHSVRPRPPNLALSFPLSSFSIVRDLCHACGLLVDIPSSLVDNVRNLSSLASSAPLENNVAVALSGSLWPRLFPFQRAAVLRAVCNLQGRVLFADDMGLGKTVQALAVAEFFRWHDRHENNEPASVLIICPATLRDAWAAAVARWIGGIDPAAIHVVPKAKDFERLVASRRKATRDPWDSPSSTHFVILAYDLLPKVAHMHRGGEGEGDDDIDMHFPIVIADECHTLRNKDTMRTKATLPFFLTAKRRILISGTPALSRPAELFPLLHAILTQRDKPFLSHDEFVRRYCGWHAGVMRAVCNVDELNTVLSEVMIRRAKIEVQNCLPPKIRRHVTVQIAESLLEPLAKKKVELAQLEEQMQGLSGDRLLKLRSRHNAICHSLFHRTAFLKIPGVIARVQQLIRDEDAPKKLLVFAHHLAVLDAVEAFVEREHMSYIRLDGQTDSSKRAALVESFQNESSVQLAILSLAVAGTGLTLTAADVVLFAELSWVPSVLAQAEDRAHRIGRMAPVTIEYVIAPGTADELMWSAVRTKLNLLNKAVDGSEQKRKEAFDVSAQSGTCICISELDSRIVVTDAINAMEKNRDIMRTSTTRRGRAS